MNYKIALTVIGLSVAVNAFCANNPPAKTEPNRWKVVAATIPLTFINYYSLMYLTVPLTIKTYEYFNSEELNPTLATLVLFGGGFSLGSYFVGKLHNYIPFSEEELNQAQKYAVTVATIGFLTPQDLKNRLKTVLPAVQKKFFSKSKDGLSVKSFEEFQEIIPIIKNLNKNIKEGFGKINQLESKLQSHQNTTQRGLFARLGLRMGLLKTNEQLNRENYDSYKALILKWSNFLIEREEQRAKLYENYDIGELKTLKQFAQRIKENFESKTVDFQKILDDFKQLKESYAKIQGGVLGIVDKALRYYEGKSV
jgi:hypothetical protein